MDELNQLETLNDVQLQQTLLKTVSTKRQNELEVLLQKNQDGSISQNEQQRLSFLQNDISKIMLQKARAAVLLRFRGKRLPTLDELRQLTIKSV